ncbi:MAG: polyprenyl synthetase family protein [Flavobacteriaceae bacterium]
MDIFSSYQKEFKTSLEKYISKKSPQNLYRPMGYLLNLGGKRVRPYLCLMASEVYGIRPIKAMGAAISIEIFHNFTLMHDDIMDKASLRRGNTTVHEKWDVNTAILSGDAMLIKAYQAIECYSPEIFLKLTRLLSKTAIEVCEGQQYDLDFETAPVVSQKEYIKMIRLKTAVLLGCALKMGAIIGGASVKDMDAIYDFGIHLGVAFQLQDDYLDTFGDQSIFGKKIGGDILENKKTILYHLALKNADLKQYDLLKSLLMGDCSLNDEDKIIKTKNLYQETGAKEATRQLIFYHSDLAISKLEKIDISAKQKAIFFGLKEWLINRTY